MRSYAAEDEEDVDRRRREYIEERCRNVRPISNKSDGEGTSLDGMPPEKCAKLEEKHMTVDSVEANKAGAWASGFRARSAIERTRNAMSVDQSVKDIIVSSVFNRLLLTENQIDLGGNRLWNQGGINIVSYCRDFIFSKIKTAVNTVNILSRSV